MPKAPRDKESATPKKRTRKATATAGNGAHAENGNGVAAQPVRSLEVAVETSVAPTLEEQVRQRAYELYVQRGGNGGSPEQDWFRALEEISSQQRSV